MKQKDKLFKIFFTLFCLGFIIWFGGSIVRAAIGFEIFESKPELPINLKLDKAIILEIIRLHNSTSFYTSSAYLTAVLSSIFLIIMLRKELKPRGWLFMSFILFYLSFPINLVFIYFDINLYYTLNSGLVKDFYDANVQKYFFERYKENPYVISSTLSFLTSLTIILILIWKPLEKTEEEKNIIKDFNETK